MEVHAGTDLQEPACEDLVVLSYGRYEYWGRRDGLWLCTGEVVSEYMRGMVGCSESDSESRPHTYISLTYVSNKSTIRSQILVLRRCVAMLKELAILMAVLSAYTG